MVCLHHIYLNTLTLRLLSSTLSFCLPRLLHCHTSFEEFGIPLETSGFSVLCVVEEQKMDVLLDIMFHHGRNFEKDDEGKLRYTPDNLTCLGDLDDNTLDVFFIKNYYKELGYDKILHCWWLVPERTLETGLRNLNSDEELREMCFLAHKNNELVDVYFEHGIRRKRIGMDNAGVDVAEEEGAMAKPLTNQKPKPPTNPKPKPPTSQKPKPPTNSKPKPPTKPILPKSVSTSTPNSTPKSTLKKKMTTTTHNFRPCTKNEANSWHSEEVKTPPNSEDEGTDEESEDVFPVFRESIRFGELQLKVGMKFNTKWDFKEAVREFTIQEGRRIRFKKNDNVRMMATCKHLAYGFVRQSKLMTHDFVDLK
ncbi:hypothetical protein Ahy_A02g009786 [Arachis hypogaea]|uniref:Uncharacterized protein n=1 Tax=Arachis hypogaea TaxID=3818 RepID=A0A445EI21_ARAHY|nr:hypothetical protein Ahy_A02g009786 [Arachis hypogaea]